VNRSVLRTIVLPFYSGFVLLLAATIFVDLMLHLMRAAWIGRWLGIPGAALIVLSFAYSLRKRKLIRSGTPARLLVQHEQLAWLGSLLVLVHAGIHLHALLPWLAVAAMLVNVLSGLTGRMLLERSRRRATERGEALREAGRAPDEIERDQFWDWVAVDVMKRWRAVHMPITTAFTVLALAHITSILLLWTWR
jgi:hypothetical protein